MVQRTRSRTLSETASAGATSAGGIATNAAQRGSFLLQRRGVWSPVVAATDKSKTKTKKGQQE